MAGADAESVTHPRVQAPIVERLLRNNPGKFRLSDFERMFKVNAVAITPGVNLGRAPATFKPVAINQRKLLDRHPQGRPEGQTVFPLLPSVRRLRLAMEI